MKIFTFLFLGFSLSFAAAHAQVNPLDTMGFTISVVSNVKDVALITGMSQSKQVVLARFFQKSENMINVAVNSGETGSDLQKIQDRLAAQFQSILSAQELTAYRRQRKGSFYVKEIVH